MIPVPSTFLYRFTLGPTVFRYTSNSSDVIIDLGEGDETFAATSILGKEIDFQFNRSESKIQLPDTLRPASDYLTGAPITRLFLDVFNRLGQLEMAGRIVGSEFDISERIAILTLKPWDYASVSAPEKNISPSCGWNLGDSNCTVDVEGLAITGINVVVSNGGRTLTSAAWDTGTDFFRGGFVTLGDETSFITAHVDGSLTLMRPFIGTSGVYTARPGCDFRQETCAAKFNNQENFGGFKNIPGFNPVAREWWAS